MYSRRFNQQAFPADSPFLAGDLPFDQYKFKRILWQGYVLRHGRTPSNCDWVKVQCDILQRYRRKILEITKKKFNHASQKNLIKSKETKLSKTTKEYSLPVNIPKRNSKKPSNSNVNVKKVQAQTEKFKLAAEKSKNVAKEGVNKRMPPTKKTVKEKKHKTKEEEEIALLPCSGCSNVTVVYSCPCGHTAYCGPVCQKKHWFKEHQDHPDHE